LAIVAASNVKIANNQLNEGPDRPRESYVGTATLEYTVFNPATTPKLRRPASTAITRKTKE
jgi:hypothetical protein